jgi:uncharacterized membrane protein YgcG
MCWKQLALLGSTTVVLACLALVATGEKRDPAPDLWIHPRGDAYDPQRHYKDLAGELYYHAENDIARGLGTVSVHGGSPPRVTADLGADLWEFVERNSGSLRPVLHFDSDGDGRVDRTLRGRIEGRGARFDSPELAEVDWRHGRWQLGIVYRAGTGGLPRLDGRYLASVDSRGAKVEFPRVEELAQVGAGPDAGLVIFKHREGAPIDLADFARNPARYLADFDELTRAEDADDWSVERTKGRLRTHFDREDLLLVRTTGEAVLDVEWGDMPLIAFFEKRLGVRPDADGCYSTLESALVGDDRRHAAVPHRLLYCPEDSLALFDAPDGYQIFLSARVGSEAIERTMAGTSILDNVRLYAREIYQRSPRTRATGTVSGNLRTGFADAGRDVVDMGRHLVTGTWRRNLHTGQMQHRSSALAAVPVFLWKLARLKPVAAAGELFEGVQSGIQVAADGVSAVNNAVVNPLLQTTAGVAVSPGVQSGIQVAADGVSAVNNAVVNPLLQTTAGVAVSPGAADTACHWFGALTQAAAQNLPASERASDALNPFSLWFHNRAFSPVAYTRTDTQLNIDRAFTIANIVGLNAILAKGGGGNSRGSSGGNSGSGSGGSSGSSPAGGLGGGGGGAGAPAPAPPACGPSVCAPPVSTPPVSAPPVPPAPPVSAPPVSAPPVPTPPVGAPPAHAFCMGAGPPL